MSGDDGSSQHHMAESYRLVFVFNFGTDQVYFILSPEW
jgi:hypothetical protein